MADKTQFRTIETDEEELNTKIRKHRLKIIKIILLLLALAAVAALGIFFFQKLRKYNSYTVEKSVERQDTAGSQFLAYGNGFIKYSNDGAIYTDANDEVYWNQTYEMKEPMADVCEDYVALADKGGTEIYIMNQAGMQGKIETPMNISRISVANQGVVAVWMESDGENYIRMYDKNGKNLVSGAFYTEKSGYPLDISLCNDGKKLAVSMLTVNNGEVCSTIKCYKFGSVGQNEIDYMVGSFDYPDVIIPQIEFTDNNRLVAFGDSKIILFSGTQKPEPDDEIALNQEIKSVFTSENYIGIIYNNDVQAESDTESTEESRHMEIYNTGGKHVLSKDFTMDYENVDFLGNGEICIRNATECQIYNTYGVKKFSYTFDTPLYDVISDGSQNGYIFIMEGTTEKVRLK